jgi:hypothetical protein
MYPYLLHSHLDPQCNTNGIYDTILLLNRILWIGELIPYVDVEKATTFYFNVNSALLETSSGKCIFLIRFFDSLFTSLMYSYVCMCCVCVCKLRGRVKLTSLFYSIFLSCLPFVSTV